MVIGRRWYVLWHQDSPGVRVTVRRWFRPLHPFSRVGEPFIYGSHVTLPRSIDFTRRPQP